MQSSLHHKLHAAVDGSTQPVSFQQHDVAVLPLGVYEKVSTFSFLYIHIYIYNYIIICIYIYIHALIYIYIRYYMHYIHWVFMVSHGDCHMMAVLVCKGHPIAAPDGFLEMRSWEGACPAMMA